MNKVVKCINGKCAQYFMHTEKDTKCPFCRTEYSEITEKETQENQGTKETNDLSAQAGEKGITKTKKESFKMEW